MRGRSVSVLNDFATTANSSKILNRRKLLGGLSGVAAGLIASPALAGWTTSVIPKVGPTSPLPRSKPGIFTAKAPAGTGEHRLSFVHAHTGETFDDPFWINGEYVPESLKAISKLMRDFRAHARTEIDPSLLDLLYEVRTQLETDQPIKIFSAYRSPQTNAAMRRRSRGVAKNSYHMHGQALDMAIEGRKNSQIRQVALDLKQGGVGYYRRHSFIHLDSGPVRSWRRG